MSHSDSPVTSNPGSPALPAMDSNPGSPVYEPPQWGPFEYQVPECTHVQFEDRQHFLEFLHTTRDKGEDRWTPFHGAGNKTTFDDWCGLPNRINFWSDINVHLSKDDPRECRNCCYQAMMRAAIKGSIDYTPKTQMDLEYHLKRDMDHYSPRGASWDGWDEQMGDRYKNAVWHITEKHQSDRYDVSYMEHYRECVLTLLCLPNIASVFGIQPDIDGPESTRADVMERLEALDPEHEWLEAFHYLDDDYVSPQRGGHERFLEEV